MPRRCFNSMYWISVLCSLIVTSACSFGSRASLEAPDATVPDVAGGRFKLPGGGITVERYANKTTADLLDEMAKTSVANGKGPLCYWNWQSLPPPPGFGDALYSWQWGSRGSYDFAKMERHHQGSIEAIRDLTTFAVARLQARVVAANGSGINVFAGVSEGTEFATYLCRQGLHRDKAEHPERCAPGAPIYNQSWGIRWPMAVTMWKFDGSNKADVVRIMTDWRINPNQHLLNILSPAPSPLPGQAPIAIPGGGGSDGGYIPHAGTAWGPGGSLVGKALPCNAIPDRFKYQKPFPQDTSPVAQGSKTYLDEALEYWSHTPGIPMPDASVPARSPALARQGQRNDDIDPLIHHPHESKRHRLQYRGALSKRNRLQYSFDF